MRVPDPDVREVIFYTETRPVRIWVHAATDRGSLARPFRAKLKAYFDYLDRDGDGSLNRAEAQFAFSCAGLQSAVDTGYAYASPNDPTRAFERFDADGDGRISFAEFAAYYAPCAERLLVPKAMGGGDGYSEEITREFFKLLDADGDGRLSRQEVAVLPSWIDRFDRDEDDCLSVAEIMPDLPARKPAEPKSAAPAAAALQVYPVGQFSEAAVEALMLRYDRGRTLRLKPADIAFDAGVFEKLDRNRDGTLSLFELAEWRNLPPDLEIDMVLGRTAETSRIGLRKAAGGGDYALARQAAVQPGGNLIVRIGGQTIEFGTLQPAAAGTVPRVPHDLKAAFDRARGQKDHVVDADLVPPEYQHLRILFDMADRDGDGRVTEGELGALVALFESFRETPLYLAHAVETPSFFRVLDANGDGRLSLRELRRAWERLIALEPGGGDYLTPALLKPQARVYLTRVGEAQDFLVRSPFQISLAGDGRGPLWFRKLDRNGDGDISLKEFPGTKAEFDRLDLDGDGLVSADEAEAAEKRYRRKSAPAPLPTGGGPAK